MKWFKNICSSIKKSAEDIGWDESWFPGSSKNLADKISRFQKGYGLEETGVVDDSTFRRRSTEKEVASNFLKDVRKKHETPHIICNGERVDIGWTKIKTFRDDDGLQLPESNYRKANLPRKPTMFVAHWDVCLSARSCFKVLKKRNLSVHFLIDNDGTIYQLMDCNDVAWHAGNRKVNNTSIGVEISNAYYLKYQSWYKANGFGDRPIWEDVKVHGRALDNFLGFYPMQIVAFRALVDALNKAYDIPLVAPMKNNKLVETIYDKAKDATFKGVVNHYHITKRKIDCAGFKLNEVLK